MHAQYIICQCSRLSASLRQLRFRDIASRHPYQLVLPYTVSAMADRVAYFAELAKQHAPAIQAMLAEAEGTADRAMQIQAIGARVLKLLETSGLSYRMRVAPPRLGSTQTTGSNACWNR